MKVGIFCTQDYTTLDVPGSLDQFNTLEQNTSGGILMGEMG